MGETAKLAEKGQIHQNFKNKDKIARMAKSVKMAQKPRLAKMTTLAKTDKKGHNDQNWPKRPK